MRDDLVPGTMAFAAPSIGASHVSVWSHGEIHFRDSIGHIELNEPVLVLSVANDLYGNPRARVVCSLGVGYVATGYLRKTCDPR